LCKTVRGTDIGRALNEAFQAMEKNDRRKIMVLVTDGEDLEESGIKAAQALADKGVVVYAVGVGTPAGSPIRFMNQQGAMDFVRDGNGKQVQSRLDEATLSEIARATHGGYRRLGPLGEGLNQVRELVETSANPHDAARLRTLGVDRFHVPVAAVTLLLVMESLVGTRRKFRQTAA
jgi:Ca-activated chloride channel family protein